ncbi:hypothetical protein GGD63_003430 [Bradyrhizobium sp. cir1]|nr:hypothetical protein [Bradyrhizobium sp. cir1]
MPLRLTASKLSKELGGIARDVSPRLQHVGLKTFLLVVALVFRFEAFETMSNVLTRSSFTNDCYLQLSRATCSNTVGW